MGECVSVRDRDREKEREMAPWLEIGKRFFLQRDLRRRSANSTPTPTSTADDKDEDEAEDEASELN